MEVKLATTVPEAVRMLEESPGGRILAGGTDILVTLNGNAVPDDLTLVHIGEIAELRRITETETALKIGCLVTDTMLAGSAAVEKHAHALWQAARQSAGPQVRNRATVGGNIGTASPAADVVCALEAMDAVAHIVGPGGERDARLGEIITGPKKTSLARGEIITELTVPKGASAFEKIGKRQAMTISIANAAAWVELEGDTIRALRVVIGSAAPTHVRAAEVEAALTGQKVSRAVVEEKARLAVHSISPLTDQRATQWYRTEAVPVMVARAILAACEQGGWNT